MRLKPNLSFAAWALLGVLVIAIAGITHVVSVLALPWRSDKDAFARIAALVPAGGRATIEASARGLPFTDPAMLTVACRYDLGAKPFRISLAPFSEGFVTLGFHSRHGVTYYGLTVQASDATAFDLVLDHKADPTDAAGDRDAHRVIVNAPEAEGFVTLSTPRDAGGSETAQDRLAKAQCGWDPAGATGG